MAESGTDINKAIEILKQGRLVAIPTETVYGLAADATNETAVSRIYEAKNRPSFDPLIVHLHEVHQLEDYCLDVPDIFHSLYEKFSPGPVTYILEKTGKIPDLVTSGHSTVGIRFPRHPLTRELLQRCEAPLAAPSANPFGYISPTSAQHVEEQLGKKVQYILDGGECKIGIESTIIDLSGEKPKILRLGGLELEEIESVTGKVEVSTSSSSNPAAPGMLTAHYSPATPMLLGDVEKLINENQGKRIAVLSFHKNYSHPSVRYQLWLSTKGQMREAAANLFKSLRELDKLEAELIIAEPLPEEGLGRAINDRLRRAAHRRK